VSSGLLSTSLLTESECDAKFWQIYTSELGIYFDRNL